MPERTTPRKIKTSSADLGGRDDTLKMIPWTEEEKAEYERKAALTAADYLGNTEDLINVLEMLGIKTYVSKKKPRNTTPLVHGKRGTFVNRGCKCDDCSEANNAYYRERRAGAVKEAA